MRIGAICRKIAGPPVLPFASQGEFAKSYQAIELAELHSRGKPVFAEPPLPAAVKGFSTSIHF